jgi:ABC-2 type transport system ATP-binding protein
MNAESVVRAEGLRKAYGDTVALDGVSLTVDAGEVFGLVGPNGAGKTTLVRSLTGTTSVEGTVEVFGEPPRDGDRSRIGLLPQEFAPAGRLTVRELLAYYGGLYDESRPVAEVIADVGLEDAADTWYENLSGGQKRRACVGAALVNDPDLLFLDEPTTGIDPAGRRALWELIESLADAGTAVLLTSHSMTEIERLSDRVGLLRDGQLVAVGPPSELIADHAGASRLVIEVGEETSDGEDGGTTSNAAEALRDAGFTVAVGSGEDAAGSGEIAVEDVTPDEIAAAVDALADASVAYESLTWTEPGLEDAYLRLTGESFEGLSQPGASVFGGGGDSGGEPDSSTASEEVEA